MSTCIWKAIQWNFSAVDKKHLMIMSKEPMACKHLMIINNGKFRKREFRNKTRNQNKTRSKQRQNRMDNEIRQIWLSKVKPFFLLSWIKPDKILISQLLLPKFRYFADQNWPKRWSHENEFWQFSNTKMNITNS